MTTMTTTKFRPSAKASDSNPGPWGAKPTHRLYRVNGDGESAIWTPIGAAWPNKDGKRFNLSCDAVPLAGRIVLRLITQREAITGGQPLPPLCQTP